MSAPTGSRRALASHLLGRLGQAVLVLWAVHLVTFAVLYLLPGDPVSIMAGGDQTDVTPAQLEAMRHQYGLDRPIWEQYGRQLWHALHGDFGTSLQTGLSASQSVLTALPTTLRLAGAAFVLALLIGTGIALTASGTSHSWLRNLLASLPGLAVSVPSFWLGLVLLNLVSFQLRLLPAFGVQGPMSLILPTLTLAIPTSAAVAQLLIKGLDTALAQPWASVARAKGLSGRAVLLKHALRYAVVPALTMAGLTLGNLFAGSVVTETVFSLNGVGRLTATAVGSQDLPVVQTVALLGAAVFVTVNLLVDLVHPLLDPRIQAARAPRSRRSPAPRAAQAPAAAVQEALA